MAQAASEARMIVPKAVDYGASDLGMLGAMFADLADFEVEGMSRDELGIWLYLSGKFARALSAIREGRLPTDDTVLDLGVYARMILRARAAGAWPGS